MWFPPLPASRRRRSTEVRREDSNRRRASLAAGPFPSALRPTKSAPVDIDKGGVPAGIGTVVVEGERPGPDISLEKVFPDLLGSMVNDLLWPWGGGPGGGGIGGGPAPVEPDPDEDDDEEDDEESERPEPCWDEACGIPIDPKWFEPDDEDIGDGLPPPPDRPNPQPPDFESPCSKAELAEVDRAVGRACKGLPPHSCSTNPQDWLFGFPSITERCDKIRANIAVFDNRLNARRMRADDCFNGTLRDDKMDNWDETARGRAKCVEMWNHSMLGCSS